MRGVRSKALMPSMSKLLPHRLVDDEEDGKMVLAAMQALLKLGTALEDTLLRRSLFSFQWVSSVKHFYSL